MAEITTNTNVFILTLADDEGSYATIYKARKRKRHCIVGAGSTGPSR
jgi:hypothetical protein